MTDADPEIPETVPEESEQLDQLPGEESLLGRDVADPVEEGYIPPDDWSPGMGFGNTGEEQEQGETLDQRLKQEVPDTWEADERAATPDQLDDLAEETVDDGEVGDLRAGRLVDPGTVESGDFDSLDEEGELIAEDVGIDGAGATAEEAAMHVVDTPDEV